MDNSDEYNLNYTSESGCEAEIQQTGMSGSTVGMDGLWQDHELLARRMGLFRSTSGNINVDDTDDWEHDIKFVHFTKKGGNRTCTDGHMFLYAGYKRNAGNVWSYLPCNSDTESDSESFVVQPRRRQLVNTAPPPRLSQTIDNSMITPTRSFESESSLPLSKPIPRPVSQPPTIRDTRRRHLSSESTKTPGDTRRGSISSCSSSEQRHAPDSTLTSSHTIDDSNEFLSEAKTPTSERKFVRSRKTSEETLQAEVIAPTINPIDTKTTKSALPKKSKERKIKTKNEKPKKEKKPKEVKEKKKEKGTKRFFTFNLKSKSRDSTLERNKPNRKNSVSSCSSSNTKIPEITSNQNIFPDEGYVSPQDTLTREESKPSVFDIYEIPDNHYNIAHEDIINEMHILHEIPTYKLDGVSLTKLSQHDGTSSESSCAHSVRYKYDKEEFEALEELRKASHYESESSLDAIQEQVIMRQEAVQEHGMPTSFDHFNFDSTSEFLPLNKNRKSSTAINCVGTATDQGQLSLRSQSDTYMVADEFETEIADLHDKSIQTIIHLKEEEDINMSKYATYHPETNKEKIDISNKYNSLPSRVCKTFFSASSEPYLDYQISPIQKDRPPILSVSRTKSEKIRHQNNMKKKRMNESKNEDSDEEISSLETVTPLSLTSASLQGSANDILNGSFETPESKEFNIVEPNIIKLEVDNNMQACNIDQTDRTLQIESPISSTFTSTNESKPEYEPPMFPQQAFQTKTELEGGPCIEYPANISNIESAEQPIQLDTEINYTIKMPEQLLLDEKLEIKTEEEEIDPSVIADVNTLVQQEQPEHSPSIEIGDKDDAIEQHLYHINSSNFDQNLEDTIQNLDEDKDTVLDEDMHQVQFEAIPGKELSETTSDNEKEEALDQQLFTASVNTDLLSTTDKDDTIQTADSMENPDDEISVENEGSSDLPNDHVTISNHTEVETDSEKENLTIKSESSSEEKDIKSDQ